MVPGSRRARPVSGYGSFVWAAAFSALAGCTTLPEAERQSLIAASDMYRRGEISSATARLDRLISNYGQTVEIAEAYYLRGLCRTKGRELAGASEDFEQALSKSKRDDLTARARASLATIAYKQGNWAKAAELYTAAIPDLPDRPPKDEILYGAGICLQRIGKWREAAFQFGRILSKFRGRPIAADARRTAGWPHEYYSIQLGAFQNADNAEQAVRSFRAKGVAAVRSENLPRNGYAMWVVMAGRYRAYAEAAAALPQLRRIQEEAYIIP